jgi:hypothetical protein
MGFEQFIRPTSCSGFKMGGQRGNAVKNSLKSLPLQFGRNIRIGYNV